METSFVKLFRVVFFICKMRFGFHQKTVLLSRRICAWMYTIKVLSVENIFDLKFKMEAIIKNFIASEVVILKKLINDSQNT